jgi:hypothetical protein
MCITMQITLQQAMGVITNRQLKLAQGLSFIVSCKCAHVRTQTVTHAHDSYLLCNLPPLPLLLPAACTCRNICSAQQLAQV